MRFALAPALLAAMAIGVLLGLYMAAQPEPPATVTDYVPHLPAQSPDLRPVVTMDICGTLTPVPFGPAATSCVVQCVGGKYIAVPCMK